MYKITNSSGSTLAKDFRTYYEAKEYTRLYFTFPVKIVKQ